MLAVQINIVGPDRNTAGAVSLTQGIYGARGNLELVACDAADGLWVFWFNSNRDTDPVDTPDVAPGRWSAGLGFAAGTRYLDAQIVQSTLGPGHLEVLALTDDETLQSWYWSPGPGFQLRATEVATGVKGFGMTHQDGVLRADVQQRDGSSTVLCSTSKGYPQRRWQRPEADSECDPRDTSAALIPDSADATQALAAAGIPSESIHPGTARATESNRSGGMTELTWRDVAGRICHLGVPLPQSDQLIR